MVNYNTYNPVHPITLKGRLLVGLVRFIYSGRKWLGFPSWKTVLPKHHEDPLKMTFAEKLYFGHKYYYKGMVQPEAGSQTAAYFAGQSLQVSVPSGFVPQQTITLSAGGDLMPYEAINTNTTHELWTEAGDFFFGSDVVLANLETVADISESFSAAPEVMLHDMFFNIDENCFNIFNGNNQYRGYDVLSTSNNHAMDLGEKGLLNTMNFLQQKNVSYCGTSHSAEGRDAFPIIEKQGIKIAFLAYTFSLNKETLPDGKPWLCNHIFLNEENPDLSLIIHQANVAKNRGADVIIAALHMGCAYQAYPSGHTINNMHAICEAANIDVLIGGHPHHCQPMEIYKTTKADGNIREHIIIYSLGDFIAYDIFKWGHLTLILKLHFAKGTLDNKTVTQIIKLEAKPFYMHRKKNANLILVDFMTIKNSPEKYFASKKDKRMIAELSDFFDRFIFTKKQQQALGMK